jgi:hypothetical protein
MALFQKYSTEPFICSVQMPGKYQEQALTPVDVIFLLATVEMTVSSLVLGDVNYFIRVKKQATHFRTRSTISYAYRLFNFWVSRVFLTKMWMYTLTLASFTKNLSNKMGIIRCYIGLTLSKVQFACKT